MTTYTGASYNAQWAGFRSTGLRALVWKVRLALQVRKIKGLKPDVLMIQEMGQAEAAQFFANLGDVWHYARFGPLNVVAWRLDKFPQEDPPLQEIDLPDYGQYPGRGVITARLKDKSGKVLRICSGHLPVKTTGGRDTSAQAHSMLMFLRQVTGHYPTVAGFDLNNRAPAKGGNPRGQLASKGWKLHTGTHIDAVFSAGDVTVSNMRWFDLGKGSDHDGHVFTITL